MTFSGDLGFSYLVLPIDTYRNRPCDGLDTAPRGYHTPLPYDRTGCCPQNWGRCQQAMQQTRNGTKDPCGATQPVPTGNRRHKQESAQDLAAKT